MSSDIMCRPGYLFPILVAQVYSGEVMASGMKPLAFQKSLDTRLTATNNDALG